MLLFKNIKHIIANIPGWRTKRKIVVIESDDWGSIRMPSKSVYDDLLKAGIRVDNLSYNRYDALESEEDLESLFNVLMEFKDANGCHPIITANTIMANPDFDKIREAGYRKYYYEVFTETYKRYPKHANSFKIIQEGINNNIYKPQFHGREHINIKRWLRALRENVENVRKAFGFSMFDLSTSLKIDNNSFMETLNYETIDEIKEQKISIEDGLNIFEKTFEYRSNTFMAPCYIWSNKLNDLLKNSGIKAYQGTWYQLEPIEGENHNFKKSFHYTGQKNKYGQIYLVRNAVFEPADNHNIDWVDEVLNTAKYVFMMKKPLIISMHRLNFIGYIDKSNRDRNIKMFKELVKKLLIIYPDIEFMSSDKLAGLILGE